MSDEIVPFAKIRRGVLRTEYDPAPLIGRIRELLKSHNESYRQAALRSGLDYHAVRRILAGQRPAINSLILLANHWGLNPNELMLLAGWPTLDIFDVKTASAEELPPEAVNVALAVAKIADPSTRKQVSEAIMLLIRKYFE